MNQSINRSIYERWYDVITTYFWTFTLSTSISSVLSGTWVRVARAPLSSCRSSLCDAYILHMVDSKMLQKHLGLETNWTSEVEPLHWASETEEDGTFAGMLRRQHSEDWSRLEADSRVETQMGAARLDGLGRRDLEPTTIFLALVLDLELAADGKLVHSF